MLPMLTVLRDVVASGAVILAITIGAILIAGWNREGRP
jgi:hypothetical protein